MPDETDVDIEKLSPDKLLGRFNKSGIVLCIILAFALHVVVLGGTSVDYIHGIINPAWKLDQERREEEARREAAAEAQRLAAARAGRNRTTTAPARPTTKPAKGKAPAGGRKLPREITTMPKPGEIPKLPGTGIGLDETEGR